MSDDEIFAGFTDFMLGIHDLDSSETPEIVERIYEGAAMQGISMVDWIVKAINGQFARDSIEKGEREGSLVFTGEYRNRCPVFVHTNMVKNHVN